MGRENNAVASVETQPVKGIRWAKAAYRAQELRIIFPKRTQYSRLCGNISSTSPQEKNKSFLLIYYTQCQQVKALLVSALNVLSQDFKLL